MTVIAGGRRNDVIGVGLAPVGDRSSATVGLALGAAPGTSEERVVDAMLDCVGRWGLTKTTVEDVARSAGLSRATVYRLFPGGKNAILMSALHTEIARLVAVLTDDLDREDDLEGCLARAISLAAGFLRDNLALEYLREHEWESVETFLAFDRLDTLFLATGALMGPVLERFLEPARAADVAVWAARVVMSYLSTPAEYVDLTDEAGARHLVSTYLMPGLVPADTPSTPSAGPVH
jgi:AcrR family transcriptional regulator